LRQQIFLCRGARARALLEHCRQERPIKSHSRKKIPASRPHSSSSSTAQPPARADEQPTTWTTISAPQEQQGLLALLKSSQQTGREWSGRRPTKLQDEQGSRRSLYADRATLRGSCAPGSKQEDMNSSRRELVVDRLKETGRQCGSCSLCCFVFAIKELDKPEKQWCRHCKPGKGCAIHGNHPDACQTFFCEWLIRPIPDHWYPLKSRMVITFPELPEFNPISA
jgi:hypothetical protein